MKITLDSSITNKVPTFKIGIIHYTKIVVAESPQMIKGRTQLYQENLYLELQEQPVTERPGIKEWRTTWKALGADQNRYRHSTESLMRRVSKQNYLTPFHSAVDLNNFFSLQYEIPIGIYDGNLLDGDITIALGDEKTGYEGLNGRYNSLKNIAYSRDTEGPFGSPFVDSKRTSVTENTTDAIQIFYLRPSVSKEECTELLDAAGKMFSQIHGGDYTAAILTNEQAHVEI
ncbi:B3/4 domain-containing protein [Rummeliibacillus sp. NPDC094406]|uniref:B3/B4 domain-containing protein n=1 Tax=Rummeliibacillus sp. NPDC094406 TaxID=3364511 RepID=UPI00380EEF46